VKYNQQLVAGHTNNLPNFGLRVSMPDYGSVTTVAARSRPTSAVATRAKNP
jgi:hypothetical protein